MNPLAVAALIALGGALGAVVRYAAATAFDTEAWPRGTFAANAVGSLGLGYLVGADAADPLGFLAGVGFCGALTTYSAFAVQAVQLAGPRGSPSSEGGSTGDAVLYVVLSIVVGAVAATLGYRLA